MRFWGGGWGWRPPPLNHFCCIPCQNGNYLKVTYVHSHRTLDPNPKNQLKKMHLRGKTCFWVTNVWPATQPKYKNNASKRSNKNKTPLCLAISKIQKTTHQKHLTKNETPFSLTISKKPKIQLQMTKHSMMITAEYTPRTPLLQPTRPPWSTTSVNT